MNNVYALPTFILWTPLVCGILTTPPAAKSLAPDPNLPDPIAAAVAIDEVEDSRGGHVSRSYLASIAAAEKSLRLSEVAEARRWLDAAPKKLRGWEWFYLKAQLDDSRSTVRLSSELTTTICVSPNGRWLATADAAGGIELREYGKAGVVRKIGHHSGAVYSISFGPDSQRLASVSRDATSRVWDVESGEQISQIKLDNPGVAATAFSPNGKQVATCTWMMESEPRAIHGVVWIWDGSSGKVAHRRLLGDKPLGSIDWSDDGETIAVGSWDGHVHILDKTGVEQQRFTVPGEGVYTAVIAVDFSHDGSLVAAGSKDQTARIWDRRSGQLVQTLSDHKGFVTSVAFSGDGTVLATASEDSIVRLWKLAKSRPRPERLLGHRRSIEHLAWPAGGNQLVTVSRDKTVKTWDANRSHRGRLSFRADAKGSYSAVFSTDGNRIYVATHTGRVAVLDARSGSPLTSFEVHPGSTCNFLAIDHSGTRLLTCSWDETAKIWSLPDLKLVHTLDAKTGVYHCALSANGRLAALAVGNHVQIWDAHRGLKLAELEGHTAGVRQVAFNPDGLLLASASEDKTVGIWDTRQLKRVHSLSHQSSASAVSFSNDGILLASGDRSGVVRVWRMQDARLVQTIQASDRTVYRLSFAPDGRRLAAATHGVSILEPLRSQPILRLQPVADTVWFTMFSGDGQRLVASTTGGEIAILQSQTADVPNRSPKDSD